MLKYIDKQQLIKINNQLIPGTLKLVSMVYDIKQDIFFITVRCLTYSYKYRMCEDQESIFNKELAPCHVRLRRGFIKYATFNPQDASPLYKALKKIGDEAIEKWRTVK